MRHIRGARRSAGLTAGFLTGALLVGGATPVQAQTAGHDVRDGVQEGLDGLVEAGVPGVLARVDDTSGASWAGTSGVGDLDSGAPVPAEGRFRAASVTKSVVATVVVQLAEEGTLDLDQPVGTWLPEVVTDADHITVRQLLNHTGGLADYVAHEEFADPADYAHRDYEPGELVDRAEELGPVGPPGGDFGYANTGYVVLGLLVEEVTGNPLADEISERVLRPAGMTRSYLPTTENEIAGEHARGYYLPEGADPRDPDALRDITELNPSFAWAAYGMVSDARDLNRFFRALFDGQLVSPASLEEMRDGVPTSQAPIFPEYGLGLESVALTCTTVWGATGAMPGYHTYSFADDSGGVTVSTNVHRTDPAAAEVIIAALDTLNRYFCDEPYAPPATASDANPSQDGGNGSGVPPEPEAVGTSGRATD